MEVCFYLHLLSFTVTFWRGDSNYRLWWKTKTAALHCFLGPATIHGAHLSRPIDLLYPMCTEAMSHVLIYLPHYSTSILFLSRYNHPHFCLYRSPCIAKVPKSCRHTCTSTALIRLCFRTWRHAVQQRREDWNSIWKEFITKITQFKSWLFVNVCLSVY